MTCLRPCTSSISKIKFYSHKPHKSQFKSLILSSNMSTLGLFPCQMVRNLFFLYCSVYFFRLVNYPLKSRWHKFYRTQNRIFQSVKHSPVIDLVQNPSREIWLRFSWLRFRAYICLCWVQSKLNEKKKRLPNAISLSLILFCRFAACQNFIFCGIQMLKTEIEYLFKLSKFLFYQRTY